MLSSLWTRLKHYKLAAFGRHNSLPCRLGAEAAEMRKQLEGLAAQLHKRELEAGSDQAALRLVKKEMTLKAIATGALQ